MKLTLYKKEEIVNEIIRKCFSKMESDVYEEMDKICIDYYNEMIFNKYGKWMDEAPEGIIHSDKRLSLKIDKTGYETYYHMRNDYDPSFKIWHNDTIRIKDKKWTKIYLDTLKKVTSFEDYKKNTKRDITSVIKACNTKNQLLKTWPEVKNFLPDNFFEIEPAPVPAIIVDPLNKTLNNIMENKKKY